MVTNSYKIVSPIIEISQIRNKINALVYSSIIELNRIIW